MLCVLINMEVDTWEDWGASHDGTVFRVSRKWRRLRRTPLQGTVVDEPKKRSSEWVKSWWEMEFDIGPFKFRKLDKHHG